ncbi:MAG: GDP-mannose-dependent alpha-(1-6)-phosphatidylinositol monomannoside mannosyltransferase [candidate division WS2 bacterium]|nr:GDP-mannose-dependent alpha-(1-6)-phosphatidylinositol monomannoside mannosyltransferase [Candidatus Lithacetigena glycinireducens]
MKILVVCQYYYPEQFRINDICEQLVEDGHYVTVLTGLPNYPKGNVPKEYQWGRKRKEVVNGVNVIRSFEIGRKNGVIGMALNYASYMFSASVKAMFLHKDFDIIFVYQLSPVTMVLPGIVMKKRLGKPLYLYSCDIWPESMKNILSDENGFIFKVVKRFSRYLYSQCDAITVTSKPFIKYFNQEHSIPIERISYIPQHAEDMYLQLDTSAVDDITDFVFIGNIGVAQDIECILDATERLKQIPKFKIHFVGDGSYLEKSKTIASSKGLNDIVIFHGRHPLDRMPDFYKIADACLLTLKAENLIGLTMPSKLQGYMAAGKAVIGAINGAAQEVIKESQCGLCVNAGDSKALAEAMKDFIESPVKYKSCGENGREYFKKHFTKDIYMKKLEEELNRLVEA